MIGRIQDRLRVSCSLVVLAGSDKCPQEQLCCLAAKLSFRMPLYGKNMRKFWMFHGFNESVAGHRRGDEIGSEGSDALVMLGSYQLATLPQNFGQSGAGDNLYGVQTIFLPFMIHVISMLGRMNMLVKGSTLQYIDELHAIADP